MEFRKVTDAASFYLVGMNFFGDPFEKASGWSEDNEIGELWKRFMKFTENNSNSIRNMKYEDVFVEVHFETEETYTKGYFDVFVGVIVESIEYIPLNCVARQLPSTQYAVFTLRGEEIMADWGQYIFMDWLPASGYEISHNYSVLYYDERFKGMNQIGESEMDVYIPVKML